MPQLRKEAAKGSELTLTLLLSYSGLQRMRWWPPLGREIYCIPWFNANLIQKHSPQTHSDIIPSLGTLWQVKQHTEPSQRPQVTRSFPKVSPSSFPGASSCPHRTTLSPSTWWAHSRHLTSTLPWAYTDHIIPFPNRDSLESQVSGKGRTP